MTDNADLVARALRITREELLRKVDVVDGDTSSQVDIIACGRYLGQRLKSGARVDLRCSQCNHRVACDPNSVRFHGSGAELVCNECLAGKLNA